MLKRSGLLVTVMLATLTAVSANCVLEGPYSVISCAGAGPLQPMWFAPEPGGAAPPTPASEGGPLPGDIAPTWWQIGFGNELIDDPTGGEGDLTGGGWFRGPSPPEDLFIGNDAGSGNPNIPGGLDLRDATPFGAPAGATCFGAAANWGAAGIDGCCDNNRDFYGPGEGGDTSDQQLNPYYQAPPGPYAYSSMKDAPMGFLLREPSSTHFAVAFVRNRSRGGDPNDLTGGAWNLNGIVNGDPNPTQGGAPNIVPWQPIPQPQVSLTGFSDPNDPSSDKIVSVDWTSIRLIHDGSFLPASEVAPGAANGYDRFGAPVTGMGVLDQPELASYVIEEKPLDMQGACDAMSLWVPITGIIPHAGDLSPLNVSGLLFGDDVCLRLCTHLGRVPALAWSPPASKSERTAKLGESQRGLYGDIGYDVCSHEVRLGEALVSQRANLIAVERVGGALRVLFETTIESDISSIEIVGIDRKGTHRVLGILEPQQGSTGIGASYSTEIPRSDLRDTQRIQIVLQPSGQGSNLLEVR